MKKLFLSLILLFFSLFLTKHSKAQACFDSTFNSSVGIAVNSVYVNNLNEVYIAGSNGFLYSYMGSNSTYISGACYDICESDSIYIATVNGLKVLKNGTIYSSSNLIANPIISVEIDKYNNIWAGGDNGLILKTPTNGWINITNQITGGVVDVFTDTSYTSKIYVTTNSNIYIFDNNYTPSESFTINNIDANINNFTCIAVDKNGNLWIGTENSGIYKKSTNGTITSYKVQDGYLYSNQINDIKFDKYGNLWASTNIGLTYYDGQKWFTFTTGDGLTNSEVKSSFIADNGYIWVACYAHDIPILTGGTLDVNVNDNNSYPVGENQVLVELYYDHPLPGTGYNKFAEAKTDINGTAHFTGLLNYNYYVKTTILDTVNLLNNGLINTYYGGAISYDSAQTVSINCNSQNISINLLYLPPTSGSGEVAGVVKYHSYSKAAGAPVPGAEIIIEQEPNDDPVAMSVVDNQGNYNHPALADGYYKIILEYPGIPNISTYDSVHISSTTPYIGNLNFLVDTTVNSGGAYADTITYAPVNFSNNIKLNIYPNPTNDIINIDIKNNNNDDINCELFNLQGQKITDQQLNSEKNKIYLNNLKINKGIYFIKVYNKNNIFIKKIIYN